MQHANLLFELPRELRDEIFVTLFNSTRLTFGMRYNGLQGERFMKPAPYSLGLLRTCNQIFAETRDIWIKHVLFNFEDPKTMLNKLSDLPDSTVSKIRHLRLTGFPMMRYLKGFDDLMYRHDSVFQLLPALQLDCLTIVAVPPAAPEYDAITNLIYRGSGWKELQFITKSSSMLGFAPSRSHGSRETGDIFRQPQPMFWNSTLLKRDGETSGASVQIYRADEADNTASVLSADKRKPFAQAPHEDSSRDFGLSEDEEMTKGYGARKALLVLVRRGENIDINHRTVGFGKEKDMKARFKMRAWRVRKKIIVWTPLDHDKNDDDDLGTGWARPLIRPPALVYDNYADIDEI